MTPPALQSTVPLAPHTTFGIGGAAQWFCEVSDISALTKAIAYPKENALPWLVLGGGSNILVSDEGFAGLVIKIASTDLTTVATTNTAVVIEVGAGMSFDALVEHAVNCGWWGLENLSSIPGTVGAAPVQNIGAYGVEVADTIVSVTAYDTKRDTVVILTNTECGFGYRTSIFKQDPGRYIITAVTFSLSLVAKPQCAYADLALHFKDDPAPSLGALRAAVQAIRASKFPDWTEIGTAGSFFKNPVVNKNDVRPLLEKYPDLPQYPVEGDMVKLSLGYILDKVCGLKGYTKGAVGLYEKQALVVVAEKNTSAHEVKLFAEEIMQKVFLKTNITIEREVIFI